MTASSALRRVPPPRRLQFQSADSADLTHYLFRYPAKFHPPVARALLEQHTTIGDTVLDPFCGSGTLLVEAVTMGRNARGVDVDPVAVFVARTKTRRWPVTALRDAMNGMNRRLRLRERSASEYESRMFQDLSDTELRKELSAEGLWAPDLPDISHWFRHYVIVDLARILSTIEADGEHSRYRDFFLLAFASVIRGASNADPVPVSGLEVTHHMLRKHAAGRLINPFALYYKAVERALLACTDLNNARHSGTHVDVRRGDATRLTHSVRRSVDCIITSPPYHGAVDYYRRHTLEMYWLRLVATHQERLDLLPSYIGRVTVPQKHTLLKDALTTKQVARWEDAMRQVSTKRADAFHHYAASMRRFFLGAATLLAPGARAILVVGRSSWNGLQIPTERLFTELAAPEFRLTDHQWYPIRNRYMSYGRKNGANINREHVLVFAKH